MITVITGASAGIGAAAALDLAKMGHQLVLVGRDRERLTSVAERAAAVSDSHPKIVITDYGSFASVRQAADEIREQYDRIDVLANNAGVMTPRRETTSDGHELMIQVNHLSPFLLTNLLLDRVTRVVTTASRAAYTAKLDISDLSRNGRKWNGWLQYGDSKQANILFTVGLAQRGTPATCFHPGVIRTGFAAGTFMMRLLTLPGMAEPPEAGAGRLVHLATSQDGLDHPGRYFKKNEPQRLTSAMSDPARAEALWAASAEATGLTV
ncbi:short-chain dehydrogenase [Acrocarpospora phusangensis]|uniref:Short-chain dehydrogenase n=1 Tax=Acrocarpospora phusangensis TaxID=1070424 RepID=A0A919UN21_9ACTN|nr:SDR family NAD(P)-dependent oxidoreductase [Acrocarpospora phusangensis]GIH27484.1 short-chain dehydrogenase [Acrocarpospora phusangensis]